MSKNQSTMKYYDALEVGRIFLYDVSKTYTHKGDELPRDPFGERKKLIHTVGVVGKVKFVSDENHPYTGVLKGADYGVIRFSTGAKPSEDQPMVTGFGLKFLRDGQESASLVAMSYDYGVGGQQDDWNFFSEWHSNIVPETTPEYNKESEVLLAKKFSEATDWIQNVGLSNFGMYDKHGKYEKQNEFPYALNFKPHSDVHTLFPKELSTSAKDPYMHHIDQLKTVPADSTLYDVYAVSAPLELGGTEQKIGSLKLDGSMITSRWGDTNLFFRHGNMEDDFYFKPEWKAETPKYKCPMGF